jgi:hypothetical protein
LQLTKGYHNGTILECLHAITSLDRSTQAPSSSSDTALRLLAVACATSSCDSGGLSLVSYASFWFSSCRRESPKLALDFVFLILCHHCRVQRECCIACPYRSYRAIQTTSTNCRGKLIGHIMAHVKKKKTGCRSPAAQHACESCESAMQ